MARVGNPVMWLQASLIILAALALVIAVAIFYGASRWRAGTRELRLKLDATRLPIMPARYDSRELGGLPPPVQRYFRAVLTEGQPIVSSARAVHTGEFNTGEAREKWAPFTSNQMIVAQRPGFDWDARIGIAPGVNVFVHDAYAAGEGILRAKLFGLVTLAEQRGSPELAQGELMRFLAEAAWYPTALLPSQGVHWEAINDDAARAWLVDGPTTVSLDFVFGPDALLQIVRTASRYRLVNGKPVPTAWQGRFWAYEERYGMRVPLSGEVAWSLPQGLMPYWRGRLTSLLLSSNANRIRWFVRWVFVQTFMNDLKLRIAFLTQARLSQSSTSE